MKTIRTVLFLSLMFMIQLLYAEASPLPMLQKTADQILGTLKANQGQLHAKRDMIYHSVSQYLLPNVDVEGMSRSVLGREAWTKATPSERKEFSREFTNLVIRTYASPLAEYQGETVKFLPVRGQLNERFVRVNSFILRPNGNKIPLSYSLVSKNGAWKIYDLNVEGVSLLQSFRSQFSQVLQNSNMQVLLKEMRERSKKAAA